MILLDVDGVCVDFMRGALLAHGSDFQVKDMTSYRLEPYIGVTPTEFWRVIDAAGPEFWRDLDVYPWFDQLYNGFKALGRVLFVTQPGWSWQSYAGKKMWFDKMFGRQFRDIHLTSSKDLLAQPTRVLVDDSPEHIASFLAAGGEACLFPQPWNGGLEPTEATIADVIARVASKL